MTELADLGLTPAQYAEVEQLDPELVTAWLAALTSTTKVKSPVGWFLAAVRSGVMPAVAGNFRRTQEIANAENWIRNVGPNFTRADEHLIEAHLFDDRGIIRNCGDTALRARLLEMWRTLAPPGAPGCDPGRSSGSPEDDSGRDASLTAPFPEDAGPPDHDWTDQ